MAITVKLFASARDAAGTAEISVAPSDRETVDHFLGTLSARYPKLSPLVPFLRVAVNAEYATPQTVIRDGDEVAVMPPVSGG